MPESALLTGPLEETNEGYAVAKIAAREPGKMYRRQYGMDCISLMSTNLYGPGDDFDLATAHVLVLPALLAKIHQAKVDDAPTVKVRGTGTPRKLVDTSLMEQLGWTASISLREGLANTYRWYLENHATARGG